jgi:16S rRNA (adenine1518-N6/adenine1519-N6)-dimethyltransferase
MNHVTPKKSYGQHFLTDRNIARKIVDSFGAEGHMARAVEVGPGTGVLTGLLLARSDMETWVVELDRESVYALNAGFPELGPRIIQGDFLRFDPTKYFEGSFGVIGNFPYNISTQIMFHVLDMRNSVPEVVGMFQKEVAKRIAAPPGNKQYGILSVLLQAWYDIEYLFEVPPQVFFPPPQVQSAVIRLKRNGVQKLDCDEALFTKVVKAGFGQRRKTLRNALKTLGIAIDSSDAIFDRRAETLSVEEFVRITLMFQQAC